MKVSTIKEWLSAEFSPFTWQHIMMRLLPQFRAEGLAVHQITDDMVLSTQLLESINQVMNDLYQTNLPENTENSAHA